MTARKKAARSKKKAPEKRKPGRPYGTTNTTGWIRTGIGFRPAILDEMRKQAGSAGLSVSRWLNTLVERELKRKGKSSLIREANLKTYVGDNNARND